MELSGQHFISLTSLIGASLLAWQVAATCREMGRRPEELSGDGSWVYLSTVSFAILALRWPLIMSLAELNADESQMLAQAMRFLRHPIPWLHVDGTTSGPLNSLALSAFLLLGAPVSWVTARCVHLLFQLTSIGFLFFTLRRVGGWASARLLTLPIVCFVAFGFSRDFVHYASESLSIVLICAAVWLAAPLIAREELSPVRHFAAALLLGAVPLAKLQVAPMALYLWLILAATTGVSAGPDGMRHRVIMWRLWGLCCGAAIVPALVLGIVFLRGAAGDFYVSYLVAAVGYATNERSGRIALLYEVLVSSGSFIAYVAMTALLAAPLLFAAVKRSRRAGRGVFPYILACTGWVLVCVFAVAAPGKVFPHYLLLLAYGLVIALIILVAHFRADGPGVWRLGVFPQSIRARTVGLLLWMLPAIWTGAMYVRMARHYYGMGHRWMSHVSAAIAEVARPGEEISVWGWAPSLYVFTKCPPATRDAIGHFVIAQGKYSEYYKTRHLMDLEAARPGVIVDAAIPAAPSSSDWPADSRHESFPELAAFMADHYVLWRSVRSGNPDTPFRIYVSREKLLQAETDARQPPGP